MFAVRDPLAAARAGLDLPGLDDAEGRRPEDFTSGRIGPDRLDDMVTRMVSTMVTHGLLDRPAAVPGPPAAESLELAAEAAVAGSVLLVNRAEALPLGEDVNLAGRHRPGGAGRHLRDGRIADRETPPAPGGYAAGRDPAAGGKRAFESSMLKGPGVMCRFRRSRQPFCLLPVPGPRPAQVSWPSMSTAPPRRQASASPG